MYELRLADQEFSINAAIAKGRKLPEWFNNEPLLQSGDEFYLKAFYDLTTCRSFGMGIGPIPWKDVFNYAILHQIDHDFIESFIYVIRTLDNEFMKWDREKRDKESKQHLPDKK